MIEAARKGAWCAWGNSAALHNCCLPLTCGVEHVDAIEAAKDALGQRGEVQALQERGENSSANGVVTAVDAWIASTQHTVCSSVVAALKAQRAN